MILGLSFSAWLLVSLATVPWLLAAIVFFLAHRDDDDSEGTESP